MAQPSELGKRIKRERGVREWSQEELSRRAGVGVATIGRVESGSQQGMHSDTVTRVAEALGLAVGELTGQSGTPATEAASAAVRDLRDVILSPSLLPGLAALAVADGEPRPATDLAAAIAAAWADYWAGNFDAVVAVVPALVAEARVAEAEGGAEHVPNLAMAWELAASIMVFYGREDVAATGAERAVVAAARGDDPVLTATVTGTYSWVLLHQGRYAESEAVALAAAATIEPARRGASRLELAGYGNLLCNAVAPRVAQAKTAVDLVEAAAGVAAQLGRREAVYAASFAPNTVAMQNTYGWVMLKNPGKALAAAKRVDLADLPGIRAGRHRLDVAQALVDAGRYPAALNMLRLAADVSPEWFRHQAIAGDLIRQIREEQTRASDEVAALARLARVDAPGPTVALVI